MKAAIAFSLIPLVAAAPLNPALPVVGDGASDLLNTVPVIGNIDLPLTMVKRDIENLGPIIDDLTQENVLETLLSVRSPEEAQKDAKKKPGLLGDLLSGLLGPGAKKPKSPPKKPSKPAPKPTGAAVPEDMSKRDLENLGPIIDDLGADSFPGTPLIGRASDADQKKKKGGLLDGLLSGLLGASKPKPKPAPKPSGDKSKREIKDALDSTNYLVEDIVEDLNDILKGLGARQAGEE
ncbi:hypothetical protein PT974_07310 [Cladobotryum mycophilum]|uniref:Uncharacterized protein n=1 Tax=Cladobotryum mycophilum TaxID=491253 RepID=A0ABR0SP67_9HYPO